MYIIEVHSRINQLISVYYKMRLWHGDNSSEFRKRISNILLLLSYLYYPISVFGSSFTSDTYAEGLYLLVLAATGVVVQIRLYYLLYKKDKICELISKAGAHSIQDRDTFNAMNNQIQVFIKYAFSAYFIVGACLSTYVVFALPIFSKEKKLPIKMYFTLNWRENEIIYWITFLYVTFELVLSYLVLLMNLIIWYLMMSCVVQYKVLGSAFESCGIQLTVGVETKTEENTSALKKVDLFLADLIVLMKNHEILRKMTDELKTCFAHLFFVQIGTSGILICCSVYNLAFNTPENQFLYFIFFNIILFQLFDIFILTYYGNEIKFWSARLSNSLFQCNWMDQTEQCKKHVIILMEVLKRPQVLVVGKLYPLDLEIFSNILNFSYGMFNILKTLQ